MKKFPFAAIFILFSACAGDVGFDMSPYKADFPFSNLKEFKTGKEGVVAVENLEILRKAFAIATPNAALDEEALENDSYFYHSWVENARVKGFTIQKTSDCEEDLYFFSLDRDGFLKEAVLVAGGSYCGDYDFVVNSEWINDSTMIVNGRGHGMYESSPTLSESIVTITPNGQIKKDERDIVQSICLWEKLSIKDGPSTEAKYVTSVSMGEKLIELGERIKDTATKEEYEYSKVRLSDGTEGWIQSRFLGTNADVAVFTSRTRIYDRADLLTGTDAYFDKFDIVALLETDGEGWYKVRGKPSDENWFSEGWVQSNFTMSDLEITVASLTKNALNLNAAEKKETLLKIAQNRAYNGSKLLKDVKALAGIRTKLSARFENFLQVFPELGLPLVLDGGDEADGEFDEEELFDWFGLNNAMTIYPIGYFEYSSIIVVVASVNYPGTWSQVVFVFDQSGKMIDSRTVYERSWMEGATLLMASTIDEEGTIRVEMEHFESDEDGETTSLGYEVEIIKIGPSGFELISKSDVEVDDLDLLIAPEEN